MSVATQAMKLAVIMTAVGAAAKAVHGAKNRDEPKGGEKPADQPVKVTPDPDPVKKPDPIRTGSETA